MNQIQRYRKNDLKKPFFPQEVATRNKKKLFYTYESKALFVLLIENFQ